MVEVLHRYNGRKIKDAHIDWIKEESRELDEYNLYETHVSGSDIMIYYGKEDNIIKGVKAVKSTPSGRFQIMNVVSNAAVKSLDRRIDLICEPKPEGT